MKRVRRDQDASTTSMNMKHGYRVRPATPEDLEEILKWLRQEYDENGEDGGFWCNRRLIQEGQAEGRLLVLAAHRPLAFSLADLNDAVSIVEVRPDHRRRGIGRKLFEHLEAEARRRDHIGIYLLECKSSATGFVRKLGYESLSDYFSRNKTAGHSQGVQRSRDTDLYSLQDVPPSSEDYIKLFASKSVLPNNLKGYVVKIQLYEGYPGSGRELLYAPFSSEAVEIDGSFVLQKHLIAWDSGIGDPLCIRIEVDDAILFDDQVRRACGIGVERRGFFMRVRRLSRL